LQGVKRFRFSEVSSALHEHWGLTLYRGGEMGDGFHDGRWDVTYAVGRTLTA